MSTCDFALIYRMRGLLASLIELRRYSKRSLVSFLHSFLRTSLVSLSLVFFPCRIQSCDVISVKCA